MFVIKCDFCKKEVKGDTVIAGRGVFAALKVELCEECGEPILKFLQRNKIIDKNNKEIKKL